MCRSFAHCLGLVLVLACLSCASPYSRSHKGYDISLKGIERMGSSMPHGGGRLTAAEGHEILVVHLELAKSASDAGEVTFERFELVCEDGSTGESLIVKYSGVFPTEPTPLDIPFGVPKGARPTTLKVGELTFDVSSFPVTGIGG